MGKLLQVLIVGDSQEDALLLVRELRRSGYAPTYERVDSAESMAVALDERPWDIVVAAYDFPAFGALAALQLLKDRELDAPLVIVSGGIGEETAVEAIKAGAHDCIMKGQMARLVPVIERELREAKERQERQRAQNALLESEMRYRTLFEHASDAILVHDMQGHIIMANRAMANLTGYTIDELLGMGVAELPMAAKFQTAMERQRGQIENSNGVISERREMQLTRKDGAERTVELVTTVLSREGEPSALQAIVRDITEERRAQENTRIYAKLVTEAQEDERKRIARELHDETAQELSRLGLDVDLLIGNKKGLPTGIASELEGIRREIAHILKGVRRFSQDLRPSVLEDFGLLVALQWVTDDVANENVLSSTVEVSGNPRRLSPHTELVLFRVAQEALSNVRKHSQATRAVVRLEFAPGKVILSVTDNGKGFEMPKATGDFARLGKLGVLGMHERAQLINGTCSVRSEPGKGTTVTVEVSE